MENKSAFIETFGDYPIIRVLDFLIQGQDFDYTQTEVAEGAEVNWVTLQKIWPALEKSDVVLFTRAIGRGRLFKFNIENPIAKKLLELDFAVSKQAVEKELQEQSAMDIKV